MIKKRIDILKRPIEVDYNLGGIFGPATPEEARALYVEQIRSQVLERLFALFDYYMIPDLDLNRDSKSLDNKDWFALASRLAMDHHSAFRVVASRPKRGRGRPRSSRQPTTLMELYADVETVKSKRRVKSDTVALEILTGRRDTKFKRKYAARWGAKDIGTLKNDLTAARDPEQNKLLKVLDHVDLVEMFAVTENQSTGN